MRGKGNYYDNEIAESIFKTLKTELTYQNSYKLNKKIAWLLFF
jgi:transposase InsO family protein